MKTANEEHTEITPSPSARHLFSAIVARSEDKLLSPEDTLALSTYRANKGHKDAPLILELRIEKWIKPTNEGGIKIIT